MRNAFIAELTELAEDPRVIAMLGDNGIIVYDDYRRKRPNQFFNMGIAESNLIGMASGLAMAGYIPYVYSIIPFLVMRPYEFIRNDICYQNVNVKMVGIGAGFAYSSLGPTHHGTEDISMLRSLPNLVIISPSDPVETRQAARAAWKHKGPVYIRIGTGKNAVINSPENKFEIGRGRILREGLDVAIIAHGGIMPEILKVATALEKDGISARVINMHTIKPLDRDLIIDTADSVPAIITVEEHSCIGALGSAVAEVLAEQGKSIAFQRIGLNDTFCKGYGSLDDLRRTNNLSPVAIANKIRALLPAPVMSWK